MRRAGPVAALLIAVTMLVAGGCSGASERPPPAEDPRRPIITVTSTSLKAKSWPRSMGRPCAGTIRLR